jgi:hypothetical protein
MWLRIFSVPVIAAGLLGAADVPAVELKPATLAAFDRYVKLTEDRMAGELAGKSPFLWVDQQPQKAALHERLRKGEVISARLETRDGKREIEAPGGLIHHWIGTVLLPGIPLPRAQAFVQNYGRYPALFGPMILRTKVLQQLSGQFTVAMRTFMKKMTVTVVIDADYVINYRPVTASRLHTKSVATNIHQVDDHGTAAEKRTPGDQTAGYLWRLNTYCSFEQTSAGTIEQCESVSLTRGIPFGFGWIVNRFVSGIPRETLEFTLGRVRSEVGKQ